MGDVVVTEICRQSLCICESILWLGFVVEIKEGESVDYCLGNLLPTHLVGQVVIAGGGDETRCEPIPLKELGIDFLGSKDELLTGVAYRPWEMGETEVIAEPIQKVNLNASHPTTHSSTTSERRLSEASVM